MRKFVVYDEENSAVQDAYSLLTANVHFNSEKGNVKTFALTSWTPRVGKTTVAINLAISLAKSGWKTLLVDADFRRPADFKRLNSEETLGLSNIIEEDISLVEGLTSTNIDNFTYLPCGSKINNPIELLCSPRFSEFIVEACNIYDFILFDTPALSSVIDGAVVASQTDATILIAELGVTKIDSLVKAKQQLDKAKASLIMVVVNKIKKQEYIKYMEYYNYFKSFPKKNKKRLEKIEKERSSIY